MDDADSNIILCVDDEAGVLASYRQVLGREEDPFADLLAEKNKADRSDDDCDLPDYTILTAASGEERLSDPVTGVFTRHFVIRRLHEEIKRSARFSFTLSFLAIGIDNLPPDKTAFGPSAPHDMLRHTADILLQSVRAYDVVARCDSPAETEPTSSSPLADFLVILAQTDQMAARAVTQRITEKIGLRPWTDQAGNDLRLSVSIGLATATVTSEDNTLDNLVDQAIAAFEQARRRDQTSDKNDSPRHPPLPDRQP